MGLGSRCRSKVSLGRKVIVREEFRFPLGRLSQAFGSVKDSLICKFGSVHSVYSEYRGCGLRDAHSRERCIIEATAGNIINTLGIDHPHETFNYVVGAFRPAANFIPR